MTLLNSPFEQMGMLASHPSSSWLTRFLSPNYVTGRPKENAEHVQSNLSALNYEQFK